MPEINETTPPAEETKAPEADAPQTPDTPEQGGTQIADPAVLQAELDKARREAAKYRNERNEFKTDAEKFREAQEAEKTELQRANERAEELERRFQESERDRIRTSVAHAHGITAEDMVLLGTGTEEELTERAARIAALRTQASVTTPPSQTPQENLRGGGGVDNTPPDNAYPAGWSI